jgi:bifunctional non-homologous end joining protein LigD
MGLPEPMLAKSGALPSGRGWSFEPKWDGYRAIVRSGENYCVRSRRGWLMTELLPELAGIPIQGVFDGELVAFGDDGLPSFDRLSRRILHGDTRIAVGLVFFDVLEVEGLSTMHQSYRERRAILVLLDFGPGCHVCPRFGDGEALWESVCERGLEGVVAKRLGEQYRPGERTWIKRKNSRWARCQAEREAVIRSRFRSERRERPAAGPATKLGAKAGVDRRSRERFPT